MSQLSGEQHNAMIDVLSEVAEERARQHEKWGEQNHPNGSGIGLGIPSPVGTVGAADQARALCQIAAREGRVTYAHIAFEEVAEAFAETDPAKLRAELVQAAAVLVAWIEKIDRDAKRAAGALLLALGLTACGGPAFEQAARVFPGEAGR